MLFVLVAVAAIAIVVTGVAFADLPYRLQDGKRISVVGQVVCLPSKYGLFGGTALDICTTGFKGSDGRHFAFKDFDQLVNQEPELIGSEFRSSQFQVSGQFSYGPDEQHQIYDIAGTIEVDSVRTISPPGGYGN